MCTVSMVSDHFMAIWPQKYPDTFPISPTSNPSIPNTQPAVKWPQQVDQISREEFDALRKDVEEMKLLLQRAKEYDERNNEPHCEMEEKVALIKKVAEMVGVDLGDVFQEKGS